MQAVKHRGRALGMDLRYHPEPQTANLILNMRYDASGFGWVRDRGWEPYNPPAGFTRILALDMEPIYSLAVWTRDQGGQVYPLYEQDGDLLWEHGLSQGTGLSYPARQTLDSGRTIPKSSDPGTQFIPHGRDLVIINGSDQPLRFRGNKYVVPFGFQQRPAPPDVFPPDPDYYNTGTTPRNEAGTVSARLDAPRGLGKSDAATDGTEQNRYQWRVTFVTETGSESPMSDPATASWSFSASSEQGRYGVLLRSVPVGPRGTVARNIYRTKNLINIETQGEATYFFLGQIEDNASTDFFDIVPDSALVSAAPSSLASILHPMFRHGASWDGCLWLAGGVGNETRIYRTDPQAPEQIGALSYYDVGVRQGGAITAVKAGYGALIVFRERSIEVIQPSNDDLRYRVTTLSQDVGTTATNAIALIPGVGLAFLGYDGVYAITGQGDNLSLVLISEEIHGEVARANRAALPRATAAWSPLEREWWCHFPADGASAPNRGIVYHPDVGGWSVRAADTDSPPGAFEFNGLATLPSGHFLIAPQTTYAGTLGSRTVYNRGLQVWSASGFAGGRFTATQIDGTVYAVSSVADNGAVLGVYESCWTDLGGADSYKSVSSVVLEMVACGHATVTLDYARDQRDVYTTTSAQPLADSRTYGTANDQNVYGPRANAKDRVATVGTGVWASEGITMVRWDLGATAAAYFKWRANGTSRFHIGAYTIKDNAANGSTERPRR
jgi:hypothetical protein